MRLAPHQVSQITIKFLERPASFNEYGFAYIVASSIGRRPTGISPSIRILSTATARTGAEIEECGTDSLCYARLIAKRRAAHRHYRVRVRPGLVLDELGKHLRDLGRPMEGLRAAEHRTVADLLADRAEHDDSP